MVKVREQDQKLDDKEHWNTHDRQWGWTRRRMPRKPTMADCIEDTDEGSDYNL